MPARAILVCILLPLATFAEVLPQPRTDAVSDFAEILPPAEEARIADLLRGIRDESGVHVVVVTMDRISNYGGWGQSFEAYATGLFNAWGIGDARRDDNNSSGGGSGGSSGSGFGGGSSSGGVASGKW